MPPVKVSIIIPVLNEERNLPVLLERVFRASASLDREIIFVDDGSTDGSAALLAATPGITLARHERNRGKGAALRAGIGLATGSIVLFQDADLEYDPADYAAMLEPLLSGAADAVYGSRLLRGRERKFFAHSYAANKFLSWLTRFITGLPVTDMETCYKAFRADIVRSLALRENRFGIEPEITVKISKIKNIRYAEVPISYEGRSVKEGKKVRWHDGIRAMWCLVKYKFF